jgi:hypothetical protein
MAKDELKRALSVDDMLKYKPKTLQFEGEWKESLGIIARSGTILIYGNPKNGKTSFALQLCKELTRFGKVLYNSVEEGKSFSMQEALIRENMLIVSNNFTLLDSESIDDLKIRLKRKKSPDFIVIDSVQFAGLKFDDYKELKKTFPNKRFVYISHVKGKEPEGSVALKIKRDADVFVWIEGYKAFATGRYGGGKDYTIWHKGADDYWGNI